LVGENAQILENDRKIMASARATDVGRRLLGIPGVGPLLASAFVATIPDPYEFRSGRNLAAWVGLVPRQNSSGGKERPGGITKQGNSDAVCQNLLLPSFHWERSHQRRQRCAVGARPFDALSGPK
jgi:transposase